MSKTILIDYGCHSFTYRLTVHLSELGFPVRYYANGSLESPNLKSLPVWQEQHPQIVRIISCQKPYGKLSLHRRLLGEIEWAGRCITALNRENPSALIVCCVPLAAVTRIQRWAESRGVPIIYWLQDLQGRAIHDLLGRKMGMPGRVLGSFAYLWEQHILEKSRMVITIADGHECEIPFTAREGGRYTLLENWANIEEFPLFPVSNDWSTRQGLDKTLNIVYAGTLGLKHDLATFTSLAAHFLANRDIRIVVVSSGQAADRLRAQAAEHALYNLIVLPFQPYDEVPKVLASAAVLVAPLEASAGGFCVPSKVLSYLCAGRPIVIAIDANNPAAATIRRVEAGTVVRPGNAAAFVTAVADLLNDIPARSLAGFNARAYAEKTFSLERVTEKFVAIISKSNVPFGSRLKPSLAAKSVTASA